MDATAQRGGVVYFADAVFSDTRGMGEGENDSPSEVSGTYLFLLRDGSRLVGPFAARGGWVLIIELIDYNADGASAGGTDTTDPRHHGLRAVIPRRRHKAVRDIVLAMASRTKVQASVSGIGWCIRCRIGGSIRCRLGSGCSFKGAWGFPSYFMGRAVRT
jgi:hypothetical protein